VNSEEAVLAAFEALERAGIGYMLVGSLSSNYYGVARLTQDADFVIQFDPRSIPDFVRHLGPGFSFDPQLSFETATGTTRNLLTLPETAFTIELFHLSDDPHDQERFRRRREATVYGRRVILPTAEDVIITKLCWCLQAGRNKDREDVRNVILVQ
jgi:hypothetical protein